MNKNIIRDDIEDFLEKRSEFTQKSEVVYLLAEIRKILEILKNKGKKDEEKYKTLRLHCNWALHSKLSYESSIKILSSKFDRYIDLNKSKREIQEAMRRGGSDFIKLNDFRSELHSFFKSHNLPTETLEGNKWYKFVKLYFEIIVKCPISHDISKINSLHLIKDNNGYYFEFYLNNKIRIPKIKLKLKNKKQQMF